MEDIYITRSLALNQEAGGAIVGIKGSCLGAIVRIRPGVEIVLGRDPNLCDILFRSLKVSRKHCGIVYHLRENCYSICDYSTNGTFLPGGRRLNRGWNKGIAPGMEIWIGDSNNVIKLG